MSNNLNNVELRRLNTQPVEFRVEQVTREDGVVERYISGYAIVFEQYSKPIYDDWVEVISRNALDNTDMSDVVMCVDHSRGVGDILARSRNGEGTLTISVDDHGVAFRFLVPNTTTGADLVALLERGDITECSFAFIVRRDQWSYDQPFGDRVRDVRRIEDIATLLDLSIVVNGQYPQTSVGIDERAAVSAMRMAEGEKAPQSRMSVALAKAICDLT
jgi:HK97 family phage prohead protease